MPSKAEKQMILRQSKNSAEPNRFARGHSSLGELVLARTSWRQSSCRTEPLRRCGRIRSQPRRKDAFGHNGFTATNVGRTRPFGRLLGSFIGICVFRTNVSW
jgi:hypothetical protein